MAYPVSHHNDLQVDPDIFDDSSEAAQQEAAASGIKGRTRLRPEDVMPAAPEGVKESKGGASS